MDECKMKTGLDDVHEMNSGFDPWESLMDCNADQVNDLEFTWKAPIEPVRQERMVRGVKRRPNDRVQNEPYTFRTNPMAESAWEALRESLIGHPGRVAVENIGKDSFNNRSLHVIGDTRNPYEKAVSIIGKTLAPFDEDNSKPWFGFNVATTHDQEVFSFHSDHSPCPGFEEVLNCYRTVAPNIKLSGDEVIKELPVHDAGYATNAESQSSNFLTEKSPPLQEIIELEKDLVALEQLYQPPEVEDSIHKKGLVVGAEKSDSHIHVLDETCIEETSKEEKLPEKGYSYDILSAHFGKLLDDAAKYFNVSRSTFKRICRDNGIKRWRPYKKLDSQSSSKLRRVNDEEPSKTNSYRSGISSLQDTNMITVKATYNEVAIKFEVLDSSGIVNLEDNVIERLKMERDTFSIKYQDDEGDWVLIACDKDLQKCIKTSRLLKKTTIKMLVDRPINHYAS